MSAAYDRVGDAGSPGSSQRPIGVGRSCPLARCGGKWSGGARGAGWRSPAPPPGGMEDLKLARKGWPGRDHRCWPLVDGVEDLGVVNPAQVGAGDPEVGMPELALDHQQRDPFA